MKRVEKVVVIVSCTILVACAVAVLTVPTAMDRDRRRHWVESLEGRPAAAVAVELQGTVVLEEFEQWARTTLTQYQPAEVMGGDIQQREVVLAREDVPQFVHNMWLETSGAEVKVTFSEDGTPDALFADWGLHGLCVTSPEYDDFLETIFLGPSHCRIGSGVWIYSWHKQGSQPRLVASTRR